MEDYEATYYVMDDKAYTPDEYFQRRRKTRLTHFYAQDIVKIEVIKNKQLLPQKRAKQVAKLLAKINKDTLHIVRPPR